MKFLKNVLAVNALSSGATGLLLILLSNPVAHLFGSNSNLPFIAVGVFLIFFAAIVWVQSRKTPLHKGWIKAIIALDILWVVESLIIVLPKLFAFSAIGYMLIIAVALWVALMAFLQAKGLRQLQVLQ